MTTIREEASSRCLGHTAVPATLHTQYARWSPLPAICNTQCIRTVAVSH